jgi:invasion protein IalB
MMGLAFRMRRGAAVAVAMASTMCVTLDGAVGQPAVSPSLMSRGAASHGDHAPILAQATPSLPIQPNDTLPGGASSLQETYQNWQVVCTQRESAKQCVMSQQQVSRQNQQRVLLVELTPAKDKLEGVLILPFGLALERGASLQIDDAAAGQPLQFRTCVPAGCVVPLSFDARTIATLQRGAALKIKVVSDGGEDTPLSVPLKGFTEAYSRVTALRR